MCAQLTLVTAQPARDALPEPSGLLYGRHDELSWLLARAHPGGWCTVVGPPGVGKTRLLVASARALRERAAQEAGGAIVAWVDASALTETAQLLDALAGALELTTRCEADAPLERSARSIGAAIEGSSTGHVVAILDNVEQLHDGLTEALDALREGAPSLTLWLGSRRVMGAPDEQALTLGTLSTPDTSRPDLEADALRLLLDRARHKRWSDADLCALARIAQTLEGLPLALELAAARLSAIKPQALLDRLERPGDDALTRAITTSFEALDAADRLTLSEAAVAFPGGWSLEGAEAALSCGVDALDALERLMARSLLDHMDAGEEFRWRLLWSVRTFAAAQLPDDARAALLPRVVTHLAALAERTFTAAHGHPWHDTVAQLTHERANLSHALAWCDAGEVDDPCARAWLVLGLALVLWRLSEVRELHALWHAHSPALLADDALPLDLIAALHSMSHDLRVFSWVGAQSPQPLLDLIAARESEWSPLARLRLLSRVVSDPRAAIDPDVYERHTEEALALARELHMPIAESSLLNAYALWVLNTGQLTRAVALAEEAAALARRAGFLHAEARAQVTAGFAYQLLGRFEQAYSAMLDARRRFRLQRDMGSMAHALRLLAWYCVDEHRADEAHATLDELDEVAQRHGLSWAAGFVLFLRGHLRMESGDYTEALICYERAQIGLRQHQQTPMLAASALYRSICHELLGEEDSAREVFEEAWAIYPEVRSELGRAHLRGMRAAWLAHDGKSKAANATLSELEEESADSENTFIREHLVAMFSCLVKLPQYVAALGADKPRKAASLAGEIFESLSGLIRPEDPDDPRSAPIMRGPELRFGMRLLDHRMPEALRARLAIELRDPSGAALLVDRERCAWRAPGQVRWEDFSNRQTPLRLFETLLEQRLERPGEPIDAESICARVWAGEKMLTESANNRLYVTINALRRAGLREIVQSVEGGYMLDPDTTVLLADEPNAWTAARHETLRLIR